MADRAAAGAYRLVARSAVAGSRAARLENPADAVDDGARL